MKNVKTAVNLRRFSKSLAVTFFLIVFGMAGSGFNTFTGGDIKKTASNSDSLTNDKGVFKSLLPNKYVDPSKPSVTPLNPGAVSFVQQYILNEGENLEKMKMWGKPYLDLYDNILPEYGVPKELKYLSIIESSLIGDIVSPAGAVGPWQIMATEATSRGLKINGSRDDRKDFIKSTKCAAKILRDLHKEFNDWLLVVAAYNCGCGRVKQAIRKSGSINFWQLQSYLPAETRAHVKRFIGTHYIFEGNGGLTTMTAAEILDLKNDVPGDNQLNDDKNMIVEITGKYKAAIIAKNIGLPLATFQKLNPDFDNKVASGKPYSLRLPEEKIMAFANNKTAILSECLQSFLSN